MPTSAIQPAQRDRKLYRAFVNAAKKWKWSATIPSIHHGATDRGNPDPALTWSVAKETAIRIQLTPAFIAHLQIRLEIQEQHRRSRVIIFGRGVKSFTHAAGNTQHVTFNSAHLGSSGYWLQPTLRSSQARILLKTLGNRRLPRLEGDRLALGTGDSETLLRRFLIALVAVVRVKSSQDSSAGVLPNRHAYERTVALIVAHVRATVRPKRALSGTPHGWILIHSRERYENHKFDSPRTELARLWSTRWNRHWHWKLPRPMKNDDRSRRILLAWDQCVFGEATATVTRKIAPKRRKDFNFAFVLSDYQPSNLVPLSALNLGERATSHRGLLQLRPENLAAYEAAKGSVTSKYLDARSIPETAQIELEAHRAVNPHKAKRRGFGLTSKEKECVEIFAMGKAEAYLRKCGFSVKDVSGAEPYDLYATRGRESVFVEVKGTTGSGSEISLTKNEVALHQTKHPANMLIVVHSILLKRGEQPRASAGTIRELSPWRLEEHRLKPTAFSYRLH